MALVLGVRHLCDLCGGFSCGISGSLGEGKTGGNFLFCSSMVVLEDRNYEKDALRKGCGLKIYEGACPEV